MNKENRKGLTFIVAMFAILGILSIVNNKRKAAEFLELKEFGKVANGKIEQVVIRVTSGGAFSLYYKFTVKGKSYEGSKSVECVLPDFSLAPVFENKRFPVVYSEKNPKVNMMLIGRPEFEEFGVAFPDSLNRISRKYFECSK